MAWMTRVLAALMAIATCSDLHAQYPSRPLTLVVAYSAGSDADLAARNLAQHVPKYLNNQPIVVANRAGASGAIGTQSVSTATRDGYTLLVARVASHAILPAVDTKTPYKWSDFTMISVLEINPYVCAVKADAPYMTTSALIAAIRANPGKLNFSSAGAGTLQNFGPQYLFSLAGLPNAVVDRWTGALTRLARDRDWLDGNARIGGIPAMRSPSETRAFVQEQYKLYEKLASSLGLRN